MKIETKLGRNLLLAMSLISPQMGCEKQTEKPKPTIQFREVRTNERGEIRTLVPEKIRREDKKDNAK